MRPPEELLLFGQDGFALESLHCRIAPCILHCLEALVGLVVQLVLQLVVPLGLGMEQGRMVPEPVLGVVAVEWCLGR